TFTVMVGATVLTPAACVAAKPATLKSATASSSTVVLVMSFISPPILKSFKDDDVGFTVYGRNAQNPRSNTGTELRYCEEWEREKSYCATTTCVLSTASQSRSRDVTLVLRLSHVPMITSPHSRSIALTSTLFVSV